MCSFCTIFVCVCVCKRNKKLKVTRVESIFASLSEEKILTNTCPRKPAMLLTAIMQPFRTSKMLLKRNCPAINFMADHYLWSPGTRICIEAGLGIGASICTNFQSHMTITYPCKQACVLQLSVIRIQRQCNGNQIWRKHGIGKKDYGIEGQAGSAAALAAIYVKKISCVLSCVICYIAPPTMCGIIK